MRLLANENVPRTVVAMLRQHGHDLLSANESLHGQSDQADLARARTERRLLVTHDKDFGALAFRSRLPAQCRVMLYVSAGRNQPQSG